MAVTTSVFPNLNTFRHGPEFCELFRKLKSTCSSHKRATLTNRYPKLCETLENDTSTLCYEEKGSSISSVEDRELPPEEMRGHVLNMSSTHAPGIINFNNNLTKLMYK